MTDFFRKVVRIILIIVGILAAGLGLRGFLIPNHFIDGGVTGTSMFVSELSGIRLSILILLINTPFVIIGWRQIGKMFSIRSAIAIVGLAITVFLVPYPEITHDKLLAAVFGGFFSARASVWRFAAARFWTARKFSRCSSAVKLA